MDCLGCCDVFHVCFDLCVVHDVGVCVYVYGVGICVVECFLSLGDDCCVVM